MIVQIYSLTDPADVRLCVEAGVDHVGVAAGNQGVPAAVSTERGRELFAHVPDRCATVGLSVHEDVPAIRGYASALEPDILHLCTGHDRVPPPVVGTVRDALPDGIELMRAVAVDGPEAVDRARAVAEHCDWLILDSTTPDVPGIGAAGTPHDWSVSAGIVESVDTPVLLAGGLTPANVGEAIRNVRPAGVDSYTGTSRSERRKDPVAVRAFVENARTAAEAT